MEATEIDVDSPVGNRMNGRETTRHLRNLGGKEILVDREGFLWYPEDWTEQVATAIALELGIDKLSDTQWRVVRFLREYFFYNGRAPLNRDIKAGLGINLVQLECVFPGGIRSGARRVAGLPNPKTCSE